MTSSPGTESDRRALVLTLAFYMEKQGWKVTHIDIAGMEKPYEINGSTPDIIADNGKDLFALGDAETCETLRSDGAMKKFGSFSRMRMQDTKKDMPFYIVVPEGCFGELETMVKDRFTPGNSVPLFKPAH